MFHDSLPPPNRTRSLAAATLLATALAGCDGDRVTDPRSGASDAEAPALSADVVEPIRNTDVGTVELDVTVTYDALESQPWFDHPSLDLSIPHEETHTWNSADQFWEIRIDNTVPQSPLGSDHPPTVDIASATFTAAGVSMTDRSGAAVDFPSQTPSLNPEVTATQLADAMGLQTASLQAGPSASVAASRAAGRSGSPGSASTARRTATVDRMVVTEKGTGRTLKRLRDSGFTERHNPGRLKLFTETRGDAEVRLYFDPPLGAVVRTETYEGGRLTTRKKREYRKVRGRAVLEEVSTIFFDDDGEPMDRITRRFDDIQLEKGGR